MTSSMAKGSLAETPAPDVAKVRKCLRCRDSFPSQWSGERICARCKSSTAWRNGEALRPRPFAHEG